MANSPNKLAQTLIFLVAEGHVPGLLPDNVLEAAALLLEQEQELVTLRAALATKEHTVTATATEEHYRTTIRATVVIADPRIYYGEIVNDSFLFERAGDDLIRHQARRLASVTTRDWMREIEERAYYAIRKALASAGEAGTAETENTGSVHEHAAPNGGDAQ